MSIRGDGQMNRKIFVLGDSRTGTTTLNQLFLDYGFNSVHYYVDEVNEIAQRDGCDTREYRHFREFVETSGYQAFTDYPTRNYVKELRRDYPEARFILSTRRDLPTWQQSMRRYFAERPDVLERLPWLSKVHQARNDEIRRLYADAAHFREICIDDGNEVNGPLIARFVGSDRVIPLRKLNATD